MRYIESFNGWFGEIAKDVTYDHLAKVVEPLADYYKKNSSSGQKLVIGYDTRYFAKEFAIHIACFMAKKGIKVFLSNRPAPSSVCIVAALHKKSLGTLIVTGDEYNAKYIGIRAFGMNGHFLNEKDVSPFVSNTPSKQVPSTLKEYMKKGIVELFDTSIIYELFIHKKVSFDEMYPALNRVLYNPFYGSGSYYFDYIFPQHDKNNEKRLPSGMTIYNTRKSDFDSQDPSPSILSKYMYQFMKEDDLDLGFVISPDCTSFEFLVGNERLTSNEILQYLAEILSSKQKKVNILMCEDNEIDAMEFTDGKVTVTTTTNKDFYGKLKTNEFDIAIDSFERFYFRNHGAPDALLCGFYLFLYFNRKNVINENASIFLNKMRTK